MNQYRYFGNHAASPTAAAAQQQRQNITKASAVPDMLAASIHNNNNDTYRTMEEDDNNHNHDSALSYDKIPDDILALVQEYCQKDVTPVTMHTLVHTGRQEVVARNTYNGDESMPGSLNQHNASGRVLIQVSTVQKVFFCSLTCRLAEENTFKLT